MASGQNDRASRPDDENPEWTADEIRNARPARDVLGEAFQADVEELRRGRGRPRKADRKVNQTLRLDADVIEAFRREGRGWQARVNQVLREHMPQPAKR